MQGTVKFFNSTKGFGFIIPTDGGKDIFFRKSEDHQFNTIFSATIIVSLHVLIEFYNLMQDEDVETDFDDYVVGDDWKDEYISIVVEHCEYVFSTDGMMTNLKGVDDQGDPLKVDCDTFELAVLELETCINDVRIVGVSSIVMSLDQEAYRQFPKLRKSNHKINSPSSFQYNCFAFVVGNRKRFWWPDNYGYWPEECRREESLGAFIDVLKTFGFSECEDGQFEARYERVAIYAEDDIPKHVALQPSDQKGRWVSKLGPAQDIIHELSALEGGLYGCVVGFLKRLIPKRQRRSA